MAEGLLGGLGNLARLRDARSGRASSWDKTGGNADYVVLSPGDTHVLADIDGPAAVRHIWMTTMAREEAYLRRNVLRMYWDGEKRPSVESTAISFCPRAR